MTNILFTCAGRRNYLLEFFRKALAGQGLILAGDASAVAPALQEADRSFVLPKVDAEDYVDVLLAICQKEQVDLLFSLNDLELPYISENIARFEAVGTIAVVSPPRVIDICFDKWLTGQCLTSLGLKTPQTYLALEEAARALDRGNLRFPLIVKPRWGSASIGIIYPEDLEELRWAYSLSRKQVLHSALSRVSEYDCEHSIMIQERIQGLEYGLDVINDLNGKYVTTFAKRKLSMRAGETDRAMTVDDSTLTKIGDKLGKSLGHVGNLDCDVIVGEEGPVILELNPRFGGGYPFSHIAGANLPAALIAWAKNKPIDPDWLTIEPGITAAKCDRLVLKTIQGDIENE